MEAVSATRSSVTPNASASMSVDGYVSREAAERDYGVVISDALEVDEAATRELRASLRSG